MPNPTASTAQENERSEQEPLGKDVMVAVDGPAGSGKSATFSLVAQRLNYRFVDTGFFYRAFCWSVLSLKEKAPDLNDEAALVQLLDNWQIRFELTATGQNLVYVNWLTSFSNGSTPREVSKELHEHQIDQNVSLIAKHPGVRAAMVRLQRELAVQSKPCIVLGRDINSVVLPNAPIKIYFDSSVEVRARRRFKQLTEGGSTHNFDYQAVYDAIKHRDELDMNRSVGPLICTPDSMYISNDEVTLEEAVEQALELIRAKL